MHEPTQRILVGGARGTGRLIVQLLSRHGYLVRELARNEAAAKLSDSFFEQEAFQ
jgi:NAD(P)-dependent dehydrogenase (short-subunit alcohol dehydrogenase family)